MNSQNYAPGSHPNLPPPKNLVGPIAWVRENLFSGVYSTILTLFTIYMLSVIIPPLLSWFVLDATFLGNTPDACVGNDGACWVFVTVWYEQLMYGQFPPEQIWRVNFAYFLALAAAAPLFLNSISTKIKTALTVFLLVFYPVVCFYLFYGGSFGLEIVETPLWGGLFLTLVIAVTGIVASFPIGVVLALGRRSKMPTIKTICIVYIEFWRGIPLITVLFMSSVMFPLFVPEGLSPDKLVRALVGVALFSSAYMAEVVRGGLQAIPKGQYEAADALGLSYWKSMIFVILPQALKMVIPGIVNTFIGLFKDTTLVLIIGLFDLLGTAQKASTNPDWIAYNIEGYVIAAFGFFVFCFSMSRYSQRLERKLNTEHR